MSENRTLQLKLESKTDSVDAAEIIVQSLAREAGYSEDEIDHIGMAVRESMVNAVAHGNGYSEDKSVYFKVSSDSAKMTVKITDEGEGFDPEDVPDPTDPANLLKTSGRGLLLMRALMDEFTLRRADPMGMEATLVKHAPGSKSD
jgi:serine/threonine-protein kinase RsbW